MKTLNLKGPARALFLNVMAEDLKGISGQMDSGGMWEMVKLFDQPGSWVPTKRLESCICLAKDAIFQEVKDGGWTAAVRSLLFVLDQRLLDKSALQDLLSVFSERIPKDLSTLGPREVAVLADALFRVCSGGRIPFPHLRSELLDSWAKAVAQQRGVDRGDPEYRRRMFTEVVTQVSDRFPKAEKSQALEKLMWEIESQRDLTMDIEFEMTYGSSESFLTEILGEESARRLPNYLRRD
jgi:hypothetical protein